MQADKSNLHGYNRHLQPFANKLRKTMTKAEACLWKYILRGRMMKGFQFRRQRPVLNYIADFMCKELMLIIEVDGLTHQFEKVFKHDLQRQSDLESAGFTVLRFNDGEVLNDIANVQRAIEGWIEARIAEKGN
jgi:very-short-patch-repair endonuclease